MKLGINRFEFFLNQLQQLFTKASNQKNPTLWLYQNNVRTPLFMIEGLCKLYAGLHNQKKFTKWKAYFKQLEDAFGTVDYYDSMTKQLVTNKKIPATVIQFLQAQTTHHHQLLLNLLNNEGWLNGKRIKKIKLKLTDFNWLKEEKEVVAIQTFYGEAILQIKSFVNDKKFEFKNIELDVHELRRKVRWLSIYPQALQGVIQLSKIGNTPKSISTYLTKDIVTSPFNKMPDAANLNVFLLLNKDYFLSMSWLIATLGKIKDEGLLAIVVAEALQKTNKISAYKALDQSYKILGVKQPTIKKLLLQASAICKTFFSNHILENLVMDVYKK
jgi:hypothetical protein